MVGLSLRGAMATKQSSSSGLFLDCFAELVIGPARPDPSARNDEAERSIIALPTK
jgi:hypothetical protein